MMKFATEAQKACYERIASWMKEGFTEFVMFDRNQPAWGISIGEGILGEIIVAPWGDDEAIVRIRAHVVVGARLSPDLMRYLLTKNHKLRLGAFTIDDDGDILIERTVLGPACSKRDFGLSVASVIQAALEYHGEIIRRWGGQIALRGLFERFRKEGRKAKSGPRSRKRAAVVS
ncbi:MAG: YbjN domain-containing protein [Planctomycetes bacterium]|nr:YbjN domain-containing protein [Planctomycetota bacterium]